MLRFADRRRLLYFGVDIKVIAPEIRSEFYRLDSEGKVVLCNREYQEGDAKGADLVIAAIELSGSKPPCV